MIGCSESNMTNYTKPKQVIIAGKIDNIDVEQLSVKLYVNRLGFDQLEVFTTADSSGNFHTSFETYTPTDVWLDYRRNVLVLVHPGDSIFVRFNGIPQKRADILQSIKFSGDAVKVNQEAARFQQTYFSNPLYTHWVSKEKTKKEYNINQYMLYLDTLQSKIDSLYNRFVKDVSPTKEVKVWAKIFIEQDYYNALALYPDEHRHLNKLTSDKWKVPISYYNVLKKRLPITRSMLISGYALSNYINRYHYDYVRVNLWAEEENKKYNEKDGSIVAPTNIVDSLMIYGIIKYTSDNFLKQMVLTELIMQSFDDSNINLFEKHRNVIELNIKEPFLKEPIIDRYRQLKEQLNTPHQIRSEAMLSRIANSSVKPIIDSVFSLNRGKVIYLDCWATWCAPCKSEMPKSKELMEKMYGKEVAFIYLCLDSEKRLWEASLAELQLEGQHYFLTKEQSADIRQAFSIEAIPHYFLVNKKGVIIEKGSHLRPSIVKEKIIELLNE